MAKKTRAALLLTFAVLLGGVGGIRVQAEEDLFGSGELEAVLPETQLTIGDGLQEMEDIGEAERLENPILPVGEDESMLLSPEETDALFSDGEDVPSADFASQEDSPEEDPPFSAEAAAALVGASLTTDPVGLSGTEATISAAGVKKNVVRVKARLASKVKSKDNYYYLFEADAVSDALLQQISSVQKPSGKNKTVTFNLKTPGHPEYVMLKYALAVKTGDGSDVGDFTRISPAVFVKNPQKAAKYRAAYRLPSTKKGLQTTTFSQLTETKSKNCFFNLDMATVLSGGDVSYEYNGKTYSFGSLWGYRNLISNCNAKGIAVTVQLMMSNTSETSGLIAGGTGQGAAYYAFKVKDHAARQKMDAAFSYLAEIFGNNGCYVNNWILGNEVNTSMPYYYMGSVGADALMENYAASFRSLYNAVRGVRMNSRVFICLDHCWTISNSTSLAFPGKTVLASFQRELKKLQAGINWNLAYHAYPYDLTNAAFWNDGNAQSADADIISPKNLLALTNYIKGTYGSQTRILISEIGFHTAKGEATQAAALALAYDIAACNPMVDGFFVRSYEDDPNDAAYGVTFGLKGRKAFKAFKYMDGKNYLKYTKSYLKAQVGTNWTSYIPGYKAARIYTMYRK